MGVYDYLKGPCPDCGKEIGADCGDIQVKWFFGTPDPDDCFRTFRPGDKLPIPLADGCYMTYEQGWPFCNCKSTEPLLAMVSDGKFWGFTRTPTREIIDVNHQRHGMQEALRTAMAIS